MKFEFKHIITNLHGTISNIYDIDSPVVRDYSIEHSVGDEKWIKAGELNLNVRTPITSDNSLFNWIAVYLDGVLLDIYKLEMPYIPDDYDEKYLTEIHSLKSMQNIFLSECKTEPLQYETSIQHWNYALKDAYVRIVAVQYDGIVYLSRAVFPLFGVIGAMAGRDVESGYKIGTVNHNMPLPNEDGVAVLWCGTGTEYSQSAQTIINQTFLTGATKWIDIFNIASITTNSFIGCKPRISSGILYLDIYLTPKINLTPASGISNIRWHERKKIKHKFQIGGVDLTGNNFSYQQGDVEGDNVFKRDIGVSNYLYTDDQYTEHLFLALADYSIAAAAYDLVIPFEQSGLIEPYYANMIADGHGYEGNIKATYLDGSTIKVVSTLDIIQVGSNYAQVNNLTIDKNGYANIDAIIL